MALSKDNGRRVRLLIVVCCRAITTLRFNYRCFRGWGLAFIKLSGFCWLFILGSDMDYTRGVDSGGLVIISPKEA